jgi:hypothetical protein
MSCDKGPELVGNECFCHGVGPAKNTLVTLTRPVATGSTRPKEDGQGLPFAGANQAIDFCALRMEYRTVGSSPVSERLDK